MEDQGHSRVEKNTKPIILNTENYHHFLDQEIDKLERKSKSAFSLLKNSDYTTFFNQLKKDSLSIANLEVKLSDITKTVYRIRNSNNIDDLLKAVYESPIFTNISKIQFITHKIGHTYSNSYSVSGNIVKRKKIHIKDFNDLFSTLYKSKSKVFDQSNMLSTIVDTTGFLLADAIKLKGSSLIIIISENSFLPPEILELNKLDLLTKVIIDNFEEHIQKDHQAIEAKRAKSLLENFPLKIKILDKDSKEVIFKNLDKPEIIYNYTDKIDDYIVNIESQKEASISNIYHHGRISLLGELLNTLQHELSNPLFGLNLSVKMLLMEDFKDDQIEILKEVSESITRCEGIIKNFSLLYKDMSNYSSFNLIDLISKTIILTKSESKSIKKSLNFEGQKSDYQLYSNPTWVSQIIFNLIINSSQALNAEKKISKEIKISVSEDCSYYKVNISDNGPGIDNKIVKKIFTPFFTTKHSGTGLGLSICVNLAKKLNSRIEFINIGTGASFLLKLKK